MIAVEAPQALRWRLRFLLLVVLLMGFQHPLHATRWVWPMVKEAVESADRIILVEVADVRNENRFTLELEVVVKEIWKGPASPTRLVVQCTAGDTGLMFSPYVPLPEPLYGMTLVLFLRGSECRQRFAVAEGNVLDVRFADRRAQVLSFVEFKQMIHSLIEP